MSVHAPIFHIAGMCRSGETLVLRSLSQHADLHVVHNLVKKDRDYEREMFLHLKDCAATSIAIDHELARPYNITSGQSFVIKQGVWEHRHPFSGFILARNPLAIYASLLTYDRANGKTPAENWPLNEKRLRRWMRDIHPQTVPLFDGKRPVEQFALFYNTRMGRLSQTGLKLVTYEKLVNKPRATLRRICKLLDVDYSPRLFKAHEAFPAGLKGHGDTDLSRPIDQGSVEKYKTTLPPDARAELSHLVSEVASAYGYALS